MVGIDIIKKVDCTCTAGTPCNRKAGPDDPNYCAYCFRLEGPCPMDGTAPLSDNPTPSAAAKPAKATRKASK